MIFLVVLYMKKKHFPAFFYVKNLHHIWKVFKPPKGGFSVVNQFRLSRGSLVSYTVTVQPEKLEENRGN